MLMRSLASALARSAQLRAPQHRHWDPSSALTATIGDPVDEPQPRPRGVDGRDLVVDEPRVEPDLLDAVEREVGGDARRLLRPGDPEAAIVLERAHERREPPGELGAARDE